MKRLIKAASILAIGLALPASAWAQYNPFTANNSATVSGTQFFSRLSADGTECNLGFFAQAGEYGPCINEAAGTAANAGAVYYDWYWGTDAAPPPGAFVGSTLPFELKLVGSVAGGTSQIGWWWKESLESSTYNFTVIPTFGSKVVGSTYTVNSPSIYWGLFIANDFNPEVGGCGTDGDVNYYCSDADGGFSFPTQQWAVLANFDPEACNAAELWCWLWGAEDNKLEWGPTGASYDSDYNDYMIAMRVVVPEPLSMGLMATGLVAMVGVGFVQRRRKNVA